MFKTPVLAEHSAVHTEGMYRDSNFDRNFKSWPQLRTAKMPSRKRYRCQVAKRYKRRSKYIHKLPGKRLGLRYRGSRRHRFQCPQHREHHNQTPRCLPIRTPERPRVRHTLSPRPVNEPPTLTAPARLGKRRRVPTPRPAEAQTQRIFVRRRRRRGRIY